MDEIQFREMTASNIGREVFEKLQRAVIGIAGLGGLGSHAATALARVWPGRMIIADFDSVEYGNLNRQQYFIEQVSMPKVEATRDNLLRINPYLRIDIHRARLTAENIPGIFGDADIIVECFDKADQKQMLVETVLSLFDKTIIISASGLAGYGRSNQILTRRLSSRHILVGDLESASGGAMGLMAPRVGIAGLHQANAVVEAIVENL
jgi:sulfur carrier protein ThiS adenylyltransferase